MRVSKGFDTLFSSHHLSEALINMGILSTLFNELNGWLLTEYPKLAKSLNDLYLYREALFDGFLLSVKLGLVSLIPALILGALFALFSLSSSRFLRSSAYLYTTMVRGIPDIVLIFLFFFGLQEGLNHLSESFGIKRIQLDPFVSGVITIGFIFGAFIAETFRGAILALPPGQLESCTALGMNRGRTYRRIIFPQAMRYALPGLSNNWLVLLKATALVSLVGLKDSVGIASDAGGATRNYLAFYLVAALGYLLLTALSILVIRYLERRFNVGATREALS